MGLVQLGWFNWLEIWFALREWKDAELGKLLELEPVGMMVGMGELG